MSFQAQYYMPADEVLRELGRLQVVHSHLDHALRLGIKRMLGLSIDDPGYWTETRGMAGALRERLRQLIVERYRGDENTADMLNKVLDDAEEATEARNRVVHAAWMKTPEQGPFLHDRDNSLRDHVKYEPPTQIDLAELSGRIQRIHSVLDYVTRKLLQFPSL